MTTRVSFVPVKDQEKGCETTMAAWRGRLVVVCLAAHGSAALQTTSWNTPVPDRFVDRISICAGNVRVEQLDDVARSIPLPFQAQTLPLEACSSWPIWVVNGKGSTSRVPVSRIPTPAADVDWTSGASFVPPLSFEQLWLPADLPAPCARMAIGLVLRNGEPRYIFPTIDTYLDAAGKRWRNRGIFSVPLAKTWLHYGESPADNLRLSSFVIAPTLAEGDATAAPTAAAAPEAAGGTAASKASGRTWERFGQWEQCMDHQEVLEARARRGPRMHVLTTAPCLPHRCSVHLTRPSRRSTTCPTLSGALRSGRGFAS